MCSRCSGSNGGESDIVDGVVAGGLVKGLDNNVNGGECPVGVSTSPDAISGGVAVPLVNFGSGACGGPAIC